MENWDKWFYHWYKQYKQSTDVESWLEAIWKMKNTIFREELKQDVQRNILLVFDCLFPWFFVDQNEDISDSNWLIDPIFVEKWFKNTANSPENISFTELFWYSESILEKYLIKYEKNDINLWKYREKDDLIFVFSLTILTGPIGQKVYKALKKSKDNPKGYYKTTGPLNIQLDKIRNNNSLIVAKCKNEINSTLK